MNDIKLYKEIRDYYIKLYSELWDQLNIATKSGYAIDSSSFEEPKSKKYFQNNSGFLLKLSGRDECQEYYIFDQILKDIDPFEIRDRADQYYYIKAFGNILYWAEKVLLFQNDDTQTAYSIVNENTRVSHVYFSIDDTFVDVKFQESAVNLPNKSNNPLSFMNDDEETYATFIEILIDRNFGSHITNSFKSILGSNEFNLQHDDDTFMLDLIENRICEVMIEMLHKLEHHIITECCRLKNDIRIEDLQNGIRIWGSASKPT